MTTTSTQLRALEGEIERLIPERQCMRYTSGECRTLSCLKAGGYKGGSYDPNIATCEEHALRTLLAIAKELEVLAFTPDTDGDPSDKSWREESDEWFKYARKVTEEKEALEAENATLKRRLDEAMKEIQYRNEAIEGKRLYVEKCNHPPEQVIGSEDGYICCECWAIEETSRADKAEEMERMYAHENEKLRTRVARIQRQLNEAIRGLNFYAKFARSKETANRFLHRITEIDKL